jgi:hypothetical protein
MSKANDEYLADGTRLFNPNRPHGTVYADGSSETRWVQDGVEFRGDRKPVGYVEPVEAPKASAKPAVKAPVN